MIYGSISQRADYKGISRGIRIGLEYLAKGEFPGPEAGRIELEAGVYAMCSETALKTEGIWEAHRKYVDIHFALEEGECIFCADTGRIKGWGAYDGEKDCMTAPGVRDGVEVKLLPGDFLIVFPKDGHMPGMAGGGKRKLRKIIVKIPLEE